MLKIRWMHYIKVINNKDKKMTKEKKILLKKLLKEYKLISKKEINLSSKLIKDIDLNVKIYIFDDGINIQLSPKKSGLGTFYPEYNRAFLNIINSSSLKRNLIDKSPNGPFVFTVDTDINELIKLINKLKIVQE